VDLAEISDRLEIEALLTRYTRAIDTGEWDLLDTVFTPDAEIDYTATGGIAAPYGEVKPWLAEMLPIFPKRLHTLGQVDSRVEGDRAAVVAYFHNPMLLPQRDGGETLVEFGGVYHHDLVRTPDGWRSRRLLEELVWKRGM
jgi:SnoaL-like protein